MQAKVATTTALARLTGMILAVALHAATVAADPIGVQWPQPNGRGSPVFITYSYSNLADGSFLLVTPGELRAATEEALSLWARYAPVDFVELADAGPPASDTPYSAANTPQIRIGYHVMSELAHAYYPGDDGLAGDVHLAAGVPWSVDSGHWNFLEAITHELGHSLGLAHVLDEPAIMNPSYPFHRFGGLGTAFLFESDIRSLQQIYGTGSGSVQSLNPAPEPATVILVGAGLAALVRGRARASGRRRTR